VNTSVLINFKPAAIFQQKLQDLDGAMIILAKYPQSSYKCERRGSEAATGYQRSTEAAG
jgi:hypothetical protein